MRSRSAFAFFLSFTFVFLGVIALWATIQGSKVLASLGVFEPPNGTAYFGFTFRLWDSADPAQGDTRPYAERFQDAVATELADKAPSLFAVPTIWQNADGAMVPFSSTLVSINKAIAANGGGGMPMISWNAQTGWNAGSATYSGITTLTVRSGALDGYIRQYAQEVKAYGDPLFIRLICGEANGNWWRPCSPGVNSTLTKADFIDAWRHVVDLFREEGVTNVAWVWNMNTFPSGSNTWGIDPDIASYYPGDGYVDWVGADHYDYGSLASSSTNPLTVGTYLDPHYAFAVAHGKPFFLAEWGIKHPGSQLTAQQQVQWLGAMFDYVESHLLIKAVLYNNYNSKNTAVEDAAHMADHIWLYNNTVNYHPSTNDQDHRLVTENGANYRGTFSQRIAHPRYLSTPASNAAQFVSQLVPSTLVTGSSATVSVTMQNTGTSTIWSTSNGYQPRATDGVWGLSSVDLAPTEAIAPGQSKTFVFTVHAPSTPGSYPFQWQLWQEVAEYFGDVTPLVTINVIPDSVAPVVSVTSPAPNAIVSGMATITAAATDNMGVSAVDFLMDGVVIGTDSTAPYSISWNTTSLANNSVHTLTAKARDAAGNVGTSAPVSVTVRNLSVSITAPLHNATVSRNSTVTITAAASGPVTIARVEFSVNGTLKCTDTTAPYACAWNVPPQKNVQYTLQARAHDTSGNSRAATVQVTAK